VVRVLCVAVVAAAVGAAAGLWWGSRDDEHVPHVPVAMRCPAQTPEVPKRSVTFDAREIVGLRVQEARAVARRHGCYIRIWELDGKPHIRFLDGRPPRINVIVELDVVKGISSVG
jgi:hypothetical protein